MNFDRSSSLVGYPLCLLVTALQTVRGTQDEEERLHHLGIDVVAVEFVQLRQPEVVTRVVKVRSICGIAAQVAEVLGQHERHPLASAARTESESATDRKSATRPIVPPAPNALMAAVRSAAVGVTPAEANSAST